MFTLMDENAELRTQVWTHAQRCRCELLLHLLVHTRYRHEVAISSR